MKPVSDELAGSVDARPKRGWCDSSAFRVPAAHIAMTEEVSAKWTKHEEFVDLLGAANLIPGPNSTESQGRSRRRGNLRVIVYIARR
jgi:hypothetical protein